MPDILPFTTVGSVNNPSFARVQGSNLILNPLTVAAGQRTTIALSTLKNGFTMQPGMVYYNIVRVWNRASRFALMSTPFLILRDQDKALAAGIINTSKVAVGTTRARRYANANASLAELVLDIAPGGIHQNTLLSIVQLAEADINTSFTVGTGVQVDALSQQTYTVSTQAYLTDPRPTQTFGRRTVEFLQLSFAIVPTFSNNSNSTNSSCSSSSSSQCVGLDPLIVGALVPLMWNTTGASPRWMYWAPMLSAGRLPLPHAPPLPKTRSQPCPTTMWSSMT